MLEKKSAMIVFLFVFTWYCPEPGQQFSEYSGARPEKIFLIVDKNITARLRIGKNKGGLKNTRFLTSRELCIYLG